MFAAQARAAEIFNFAVAKIGKAAHDTTLIVERGEFGCISSITCSRPNATSLAIG